MEAADARGFLEALFQDAVSERRQVVVFEATTRRCAWCPSIDRAVEETRRADAIGDAYFGVALQDPDLAVAEASRRAGRIVPTDGTRGFASTAVAIGGAWVDLDFAGPRHTKPGLPDGMETVLAGLRSLPEEHSAVVATGGGVHAWWFLKEPLLLETPEQRGAAEAAVRGWQRYLAARCGWTVDPTADLARVLRLPGTRNHKGGLTDVSLAVETGRRVTSIEDLTRWAPPPEQVARGAPVQAGLFVVDPAAEPPAAKLMVLIDADSKFAATWHRKREFPSQSEYDMALASMAAGYGWTDQEVVNLLVAHRRAAQGEVDVEKVARTYRYTLEAARAGKAAAAAHEDLVEVVHAVQSGEVTAEAARPDLISKLSTMIGFEIRRVIKFLGDPPSYRLVLPEGEIDLGGVETILTWRRFSWAIAACRAHVMRPYKDPQWRSVAQAILSACEELDLGPDSSHAGGVTEWTTTYLLARPPAGDRDECIRARRPFVDRGHVYVFLSELRRWVGVRQNEPVGRRELARRLRLSGATMRVFGVSREGRSPTTTCAWLIPWVYPGQLLEAVKPTPGGGGGAVQP